MSDKNSFVQYMSEEYITSTCKPFLGSHVEQVWCVTRTLIRPIFDNSITEVAIVFPNIIVECIAKNWRQDAHQDQKSLQR